MIDVDVRAGKGLREPRSRQRAQAGVTTIIPILGDQLSPGISSLKGADPATSVVVMMEVAEEATYVRHHKRKIAFLFSAMRHHADALRAAGWRVEYQKLDDQDAADSFTAAVVRAVTAHAASRVVVTEAGEWRVAAMLESWETLLGVTVEIRGDDRFLCSHAEFDAWADGRTELTMEWFYREMRRKTGLLMDGGKPIGGRWNLDRENRKPANRDLFLPRRKPCPPDEITSDVLALVADRFAEHPGSLDGFDFAVTAAQAAAAEDRFVREALPAFGDNQDAMVTGEPLLWHAFLSPYMNAGLLDPIALCRRVDAEYRAGSVPLNSAEGFIRQIIGWREYMRGIYWREGPDFTRRNHLDVHRPLPRFYWTGETGMHCLSEVIGQTLDLAYAHHIQRLMVTGNFALLIGADPFEVHKWYLEVYADAYEWVEAPNVVGMSQFADGGLIGSKPYISSGAYINRMSDYCGGCRYKVGERTGPDACPFNALYWDFLDRNRERIGDNRRLAGPYRTLDQMAPETVDGLRRQAAGFLERLDASGPPY